MRIAIKTAEALEYLHSSATGIIGHGGVSTSTILLDDNFVPKLTDFSRARKLIKKSEATAAHRVISSSLLEKVLYDDPSCYGSVLINLESDVYNFGVVLMALISRDKNTDRDDLILKFTNAYATERSGKEMFDRDVTAEEDITLLEEIGRLALQCTILKGDEMFKRPTMKEVAAQLRMLRRSWKERTSEADHTRVIETDSRSVMSAEPRLPNLMRHLFGYRRISASDPINTHVEAVYMVDVSCNTYDLDSYDSITVAFLDGTNHAVAHGEGKCSPLTLFPLARKNKTSKKQQPSASGGLLKLLLSKILRGRSAAPPRKPAALQFSDSFKIAAVAPAPPPCAAVKTAGGEAKVEQEEEDSCCYSDGEYYSDEEKQQLSPVSVLEHPFESSKVSPSKNNAMDVFRELLDAAYSPALLTQLLAKTNDLVAGDEDDDYHYRTSPKNCREDESAAAYWDTHRAELARVSELVASEVPASKLAAGDVVPERQDVGAEVEAAVFDALLMELVAELGNGCC
nr:unnamed protein product [Digitaria exilis]